MKNDKETLAQKYEQEEEFLTNDLMRKIKQVCYLDRDREKSSKLRRLVTVRATF